MNTLQSIGVILTLTTIYITTLSAAYGAEEGSGCIALGLFFSYCIGVACIFIGSLNGEKH